MQNNWHCDYCLLPYVPNECACGAITLNAKSALEKQKLFCSAKCAHAYVTVHPKDILFCIPPHLAYWDSGTGCFMCEKTDAELYVAVDAPYGSELDSIERPVCFCSLTCLLAALARDAEQASRFNIGPWHLMQNF
jgi:hypothetical protein